MSLQQKLSTDLSDWLQTVAREVLFDGNATIQIDVERTIERSEANIYFCKFAADDAVRSLCVKQFTHSEASEVEALFERSRRMQSALDERHVASPRFLACNPQQSSIAMTTEPGESLEDLIVRSFYRDSSAADRCMKSIDKLAVSQAALNQADIPESVSLAQPCSNEEYVKRIQEYLQHPFVLECFNEISGSPQRLIDALPAEFWSRHEKRLLHGDFQAKNVLVGDDCDIVLIDMDFGRGHPLFDVSQFLTQLVRLGRRWRFPKATRLLRQYGDRFVDAYSKQGFQYLRVDLPFFMIWAMTFSLLGDAHYPAAIRWYIKRHLRTSELPKGWGLMIDAS